MPTPPSTTPPPAMRTAATPSTAPDRVVRRRDGIALAATGAIPDRVRAQILAEHRAHLTGCARDGVRARLDAGLLPLPIPYGYRRMNTLRAPGHPDTQHPLTTGSGPTAMSTTRNCRCGRAPAQHWLTDPDSADTVRYMAGRIRFGMTAAQLATHLNNDPDLPPLLTLSGRPGPRPGEPSRPCSPTPSRPDTASGAAPTTAAPAHAMNGWFPRPQPTPRSSARPA